MTNTEHAPRLTAIAMCGAMISMLAGCSEQAPTEPSHLEPVQSVNPVAVDLSAPSAAVGSRVTVSVRLAPLVNGEAARGLEATLRFDPQYLSYRGVILQSGAAVLPNDAEASAGSLPFVALAAETLTPRAASFAFEVLSEGFSDVYLEHTTAYDAYGGTYTVERVAATPATGLPDPWLAERPTLERLARHLDPTVRTGGGSKVAGPQLTVGLDDVLMGDAFGDGTINGNDAMALMSVLNGMKACGENIPGPTIDCVAGNVYPENLPGVGGPLDACRPGVEVCGSAADGWITMQDVVKIQDRINNPASASVVGYPSAECRRFCPPCEPDGRCPPIMPGGAPAVIGFSDIYHGLGDPPTYASLWDAFEDAEDADTDLTYTIELVTGDAITNQTLAPFWGRIRLWPIAGATGTQHITIRATDTDGLYAEATLTVHIS